MAFASITGYRSPVDLGLPKTPLTNNPELYEEFTGVYNAIHLLNQYLDRLRSGATGGGGSEQTPDITAGFSRFFVMKALQPMEPGDIISPHVGSDGYVKGTLANILGPGAVALCTHVALTQADIGEDVRIGVGPGVIPHPLALPGQQMWGISSRTTTGVYAGNGELYPSDPGAVGGAMSIPVAVGVAVGFAIVGNYISR